jgi:type IV secretion system protein TrbG
MLAFILIAAMVSQQVPFDAIARELQKDPKAEMQEKAMKVLRDVPELPHERLPETAKAALAVSEPWKRDVRVPATGKDGRVLYTFGAGLATVVCAPLRICVLELQPGEQVLGEPHIGDSVRWNIAPAVSGVGSNATNLVIIKPKEAGLDTNLVVPTNRRAYYVRLLSRQEEYLPWVAFSYPDDEMAKWKPATVVAPPVTTEPDPRPVLVPAPTPPEPPVNPAENLNFAYEVTGGNEFLRPVRVFDDGRKTYIQMPNAAAVREAPILVVSGLDTDAEMVNYRVKENTYIVDRLFERGALVLGSGKKQQRVEISRGPQK